MSPFFGVDLGIVIGILVVISAMIIYSLLAIRKTSERLGVPKIWSNIVWFVAPIPYLMANTARKAWWPTVVLPVLISIAGIFSLSNVGIVVNVVLTLCFIGYVIYLKWIICEYRGIHGWWALVTPGLAVLAGILAATGLEIVGIIFIILGMLWYLILWGILAWGK